jgi:hypothetical protein
MKELTGILIHWHNFERRRIEEHKSKIQMCEAVQVEILRRHSAAGSGIGPGFIIPNISALDTTTVFVTRWSLNIAAATEVFLAPCIDVAKL